MQFIQEMYVLKAVNVLAVYPGDKDEKHGAVVQVTFHAVHFQEDSGQIDSIPSDSTKTIMETFGLSDLYTF